jgi:RNA polymerase sigma-70 factor (ECF subfamily)
MIGAAGSDHESAKDDVNGHTADVARLFDRYAQHLARLAEEHLSRKVAGRLDGEDVVQSVFRTFFRRYAQGEFRIDSSGQIWKLLAKITLLKVRAEGRFHSAKKRDVGVESPVDVPALREVLSREPGPAETVALVDQIEALVRGLPPLYADLLELRLHGCSTSEIAQELRVSRRTVQRALNLLQQRLARSTLDDGR